MKAPTVARTYKNNN